VTESTGFAERTAAIDTLQRLRQAGIHTALDDFGTGLATFDYLKSLPLDVVKIDGSFIRHIATSRADQRIVEAVCMVASTLGLRTVAEFVETPDQRALLAAYGVDQVQGYGIARPVPFVGYLAGLRSGD
jgi:EAL domain-containing protein (putative c-di-GMP-specific phosphodiesterase class I)